MSKNQNPIKPMRPATRKQQELARIVGTEPKTTLRDAYKRAYNADNMKTTTIDTEVQKTLSKPSVQLELSKYSKTAENVLLEVMNYSKELGKTGNSAGASYASVALTGAKDILDRVHGKARQQVDVTTTGITLNIDLTTALDVNDTTE